jgi:hypothetical protein
MLPWLQCDFEALMVGDVVIVVTANDYVRHVDVASEHLVKMSTLTMSLSAALDRWCEVALGECLTYHRDVIVEVPADDDRGMKVLLDDIPRDIDDLPCSVLPLMLLSRLNVKGDYLNSVATDLQLSPAKMCSHGLNQRKFRIGERRRPTDTMTLCNGLKRPEAVEEEWTLEFGLVEAY